MKLSAVILTKNEEDRVGACLRSLSFCDEIIAIDNHSTDKTLDILKKTGVKIYERDLKDDFSASRNFGLEKARGAWILFIDADEVVTPELQKNIKAVTATRSNPISAYYLKRRDFFWGRELRHGETSTVRRSGLLRLVRKGSGRWVSPVHETYNTSGETGILNGFVDHKPHQTVSEFIEDINFYSTLRARELQKQGAGSNLLSIVAYPKMKFLYTYFVKLGFLDGPAGFAYAFFMSFHSFLVRSKLYQLRKLT